MKEYKNLLQHVLNLGVPKRDRTGTGVLSTFGYQMRFDLQKGLPLVTTKKIHMKSVIHELLWILSGSTNIEYLKKNKVKIWDSWATEAGELGPMYGKQWTAWDTGNGEVVNQIKDLVDTIRSDPNSRRMVVTAWNPSDLPDTRFTPQENAKVGKMALATCHAFFQFYVADGKLSCQLYQRSADVFLGVPFNIASYALLVHMLAQQTGLNVGEFIWVGGDVHLYNNTLHQAQTQLKREEYPLPRLEIIRKPSSIFEYHYDDFNIVGYKHHEHIKAEVSV